MMYKKANIHQRINAKNNAKFLYTSARYMTIINRDTDMYSGARLMLKPDQQHESRA